MTLYDIINNLESLPSKMYISSIDTGNNDVGKYIHPNVYVGAYLNPSEIYKIVKSILLKEQNGWSYEVDYMKINFAENSLYVKTKYKDIELKTVGTENPSVILI